MVLLVGIQELCVLLGQNGAKLRICELLCKLYRFFRETTEFILVENSQIVAVTAFITQIMVEIPQRRSKLIALKSLCFRKLNIGCEFALI